MSLAVTAEESWWCGKPYRRQDGSMSASKPHPLLDTPDPLGPLFFHANPRFDPYTWETEGELVVDVRSKVKEITHADIPIWVRATRTSSLDGRLVNVIPQTRLHLRPGVDGFDSACVKFSLEDFLIYVDPKSRRFSSSPRDTQSHVTSDYDTMISSNRLTVYFSADALGLGSLAVRSTVLQRLDPIHPYGGSTVKVDLWTSTLIKDTWESDMLAIAETSDGLNLQETLRDQSIQDPCVRSVTNPGRPHRHSIPIVPFGGYTSTPYFFSQDPGALDLNLTRLRSIRGHTLIHPVPPFSDSDGSDDWTKMGRLVEAAERGGVGIVYDMRHTWRDEKSVQKQVEMWRGKKGVLAWYTADEPDGANSLPNHLSSTANLIRRLDPYRPTTLALNCARFRLPAFLPSASIIMVDPYPVGTDPSLCSETEFDCGCDECWTDAPDEVGKRVDGVKERVGWAENKVPTVMIDEGVAPDWDAGGCYEGGGWSRGARTVVWTVVQAFGGAEYWKSPGLTWWLSPTLPELEAAIDSTAQTLHAVEEFLVSGRRMPWRGWEIGIAGSGAMVPLGGEGAVHVGGWLSGVRTKAGAVRLLVMLVNAKADECDALVRIRRQVGGRVADMGTRGDPLKLMVTTSNLPTEAASSQDGAEQVDSAVVSRGWRVCDDVIETVVEDVDGLRGFDVELDIDVQLVGFAVRVLQVDVQLDGDVQVERFDHKVVGAAHSQELRISDAANKGEL
ncbi:hypothetical protein HDU93_008066 [Gonapodya sp. JEL0774]|nr:hypothetical protein HDU93_008066 [Gonapodya sp. JEL0774]